MKHEFVYEIKIDLYFSNDEFDTLNDCMINGEKSKSLCLQGEEWWRIQRKVKYFKEVGQEINFVVDSYILDKILSSFESYDFSVIEDENRKKVGDLEAKMWEVANELRSLKVTLNS